MGLCAAADLVEGFVYKSLIFLKGFFIDQSIRAACVTRTFIKRFIFHQHMYIVSYQVSSVLHLPRYAATNR